MSDTRIINISKIIANDCYEISKSFEEQQWQKPIEQYIQYMDDQNNGLIDVLLAKDNNKFAGYCIIQWKSEYTFFYKNDIPEIKDLNVLKKYQRKGIATALMEETERRIFYKSNLCGLQVGLTNDYGKAHQLYIKRGYVPDGNGLIYKNINVKYNERVVVDDDLTIALLKAKKEN